MKIRLLIYGNPGKLTGGYLYNKHITDGLAAKGYEIDTIQVKNGFQLPANVPSGSWLVCDSLALPVVMDHITGIKRTWKLCILMHLPFSLQVSEQGDYLVSEEEKQALNQADRIIVTGNFLCRMLSGSGIHSSLLSVVSPGTEFFPRKVGYNETPFELLCVANYVPGKGYDLLFRALANIRHRKWMLRTYGDLQADPAYSSQLNDMIMALQLQDRIQMNGLLLREQLSDVFLKADLFILPSRFETFGMVLTESLAHGIPVISTVSGNIPETVPHGTGILIPPGDADELARVIDSLMEDPKKYASLCNKASAYHEQARSWTRAVDEFEKELFG